MEETQNNSVPKQSNGLMVGIVGLIALIVIGGVGYKLYNHIMRIQSQDSMHMVVTPTPVNAMTVVTPTEAASPSAQEVAVTVTGSNFTFAPKEIHVKMGQTVKLTFANSQGMHDFVLDAFQVKTPVIAAGKTAEVEFTASKKGSFQYYCSVGNHRAMGMVGTLIVE
jgi:plastocyanin